MRPTPSSTLTGRVLAAADGVRISARHDPPADGAAPDLGFVVAHGFTGSWRQASRRAIVSSSSRPAAWSRSTSAGHGSSGGRSTVGDREVLDLDAAVRWVRHLGYRRLVPVGWSMGAGVAIRHAALHRGVDAVVAVSGPSRWFYRGTAPMRLLHRGVGTRIGRGVLALGYRTRIRSVGWARRGPLARATGRPRRPDRPGAAARRPRRPGQVLPGRARTVARRGRAWAGRAVAGTGFRARRGRGHTGPGAPHRRLGGGGDR